MKRTEKIIDHFIQRLKQHFTDQVQVQYSFPVLEIKTGKGKLHLSFFTEKLKEGEKLRLVTAKSAKDIAKDAKQHPTTFAYLAPSLAYFAVKYVLPMDILVTKETQVLAMLQSKLQLNKKVFARKCSIKKITGPQSKTFLNQYHLMGYAKTATHLGLFLNNELIAVAAFSSGRKMNRLEAHQRSYELVRFCCKEGVTVTGGLSRLLKYFIDEKHPGDIMTYIDKQFSDGASYLKNGFKKHSETTPQQFLVNKKTFERRHYKGEAFDKKEFYLTENSGNIKLVYKIGR